MKKLDSAMLALLFASAIALATSASAAPVSPRLHPTAADRPVILISDNCETDEEGITHCYDPPPQQTNPQYEQPRGPSNTKRFLDALQRAAEQAAAEKRERDRRRAIQAEERRRQKAAERERRRKEAAAEKKRKQKQAEKAERDRKRRQAEKDEQDRKRRQADADKDAENEAKAAPPPQCDGKTCAGGEYLDGDCRCVKGGEGGTTETTTLDGNPVTVVIGPTDEFPPPHKIPDSICQLKIGNTTIFCDGYLPGLPPTRTSCRGRTENGCYLRPVTVERLDGESGQACMQFCINKRRPPVVTEVEPPEQPKKPPTVVVQDPGKPAVPTGTATVYSEPKHPPTPAVKTGTATVTIWPKPRATPAVKTATAATRVWPKLAATPAVQTATAATYVEPVETKATP